MTNELAAEINYNNYINFVGINGDDRKVGVFTYTNNIKFLGIIYPNGKINGKLCIENHEEFIDTYINKYGNIDIINEPIKDEMIINKNDIITI